MCADLAFAHSSIVTRDVAGSEFKYAKIMTLPFFGSGVVELPPEGYKRAKNSRKMQMCFFVHEGKVMVEVGAASSVREGEREGEREREGNETNQFAVSRGGVWVVPRGELQCFLSFFGAVGWVLHCDFGTPESWRSVAKAVTHRFHQHIASHLEEQAAIAGPE